MEEKRVCRQNYVKHCRHPRLSQRMVARQTVVLSYFVLFYDSILSYVVLKEDFSC